MTFAKKDQITKESTALTAIEKRRKTLHQGRVKDQFGVLGYADDSIISNTGAAGIEAIGDSEVDQEESRLTPQKLSINQENVKRESNTRYLGGSLTHRQARRSMIASDHGGDTQGL